MIKTMPSLALAFAAVLLMSSSASAEDYIEGPIWTYRPGDGPRWVGTDSYCARSGYPAGTLLLQDIDPEDVEVARLGPAHAVLHFATTGDVILLGLYLEQGEDCAIGAYRIKLDDGTVWSATRRELTLPFQSSYPDEGTSRADRLYGSDSYHDALYGLAGADRLYGEDLGDVLDGGEGADRLYGDEGDDFLYGGAGNDRLTGGSGHDSYLFHAGFGDDVIDDSAGTIRLLFANAYEHNLTFTRQSDDLIIQVDTGDRVVLRSYYRNSASLVSIVLYSGRLEGQALRDRLP